MTYRAVGEALYTPSLPIYLRMMMMFIIKIYSLALAPISSRASVVACVRGVVRRKCAKRSTQCRDDE